MRLTNSSTHAPNTSSNMVNLRAFVVKTHNEKQNCKKCYTVHKICPLYILYI